MFVALDARATVVAVTGAFTWGPEVLVIGAARALFEPVASRLRELSTPGLWPPRWYGHAGVALRSRSHRRGVATATAAG
ncbi:MAG: hypothetical protein ACRDQX_15375 [Pseudonocardiaceae bacterium]